MRTTKQTAFVLVALCLLLGTCQASSTNEDLEEFAPLNLKPSVNKEIIHSSTHDTYAQQR